MACLAASALAACSDRAALPELPEPVEGAELLLSELGLYRDLVAGLVAPDTIEFEPAHPLWSDGLDKRRWLRLPAGERIDTSDMDAWQFPVGAILFKEFSSEGRRIETRVIARTGDGARDYWMGAFVWNDDESDARLAPAGQRDARGTRHDVPAARTCPTCHNGAPGRVLGFSAVQQPLAAPELLSHPMTPFVPPGDAASAAALGYLHGNCAHCHNPGGSARPDSDMDLRLSITDVAPAETAAHRTAVGRPVQSFVDSLHRVRVAPGDPENSALLARMAVRGSTAQMPPLASEIVDEAGVALVRAWIERMGE
jgi:mono/diheme cytochrome c family protein